MRICLCRKNWKSLSKAYRVCSIDFHQTDLNMQPFQADLELDIACDGVFNAIAFWFNLHLDEETILSSGPDQSRVCFTS